MIFNILVGNEDDHAKNHACFWDGSRLSMTPAYDLLPQRRIGMEGRQAMIVGELEARRPGINSYERTFRAPPASGFLTKMNPWAL